MAINIKSKQEEAIQILRKIVDGKEIVQPMSYVDNLLKDLESYSDLCFQDEKTFTAIDFETAQPNRSSICQIGLVRVENGVIAKELSLLVQPPQNIYWKSFVNIHGISPEDTLNSPTFYDVWHKIEPYITNQKVVAHNGFRFDFPVLSETLKFYDLFEPTYEKFCTYKIYKKKLNIICEEMSITLHHHDALSDARACALLFLKSLK